MGISEPLGSLMYAGVKSIIKNSAISLNVHGSMAFMGAVTLHCYQEYLVTMNLNMGALENNLKTYVHSK